MEPIVSDSLDDVRLLVQENRDRGNDNEILSVHKLCSNPIVKVISTRMTILKSFMESAEVANMENEMSEHILDDANVLTSPGVLLESDILKVLKFPQHCSDPVTMVVKITAGAENSSLFDYKIVLKSNTDWMTIPAELQEEYVKFSPPVMQYFFVISSDKWIAFALNPQGSVFESGDVKDVTVTFPSGCVRNDCKIDIQVICPKPVNHTEIEHPDDDANIIGLSPRIWVKHDEMPSFQKPIVVTLPLPSTSPTENDTRLFVIQWTEDDDIFITDANISLKENVCKFEVQTFSGSSVLSIPRSSIASLRSNEMDENLKSNIKARFQIIRGCLKTCNILIFSDTSAVNTLRIEIMESNCVDNQLQIVKSTKKYLRQIAETISDPISIRYGEKVRIYAIEGIQLHSRYEKGYIEIRFQPNKRYNHKRFEVVRKEPESSAVLKFKLGEKESHECHFEANDWLRQREVRIFHQQGTAVSLKSLHVLASQIPVHKIHSLAAELDVDDTVVENLKTIGHRGTDLTVQVILQWCRKGDKQEPEMVSELSTALKMLSLGKLASKLVEASKAGRRLVPDDFKV